ncbi:MAG TPA: peptidoglycan DD-metalloendopeptidase family protein [Steroidobacteraceae bacterium]|jgi:septal ring factor EnvC (AmiA/AmiB activator)
MTHETENPTLWAARARSRVFRVGLRILQAIRPRTSKNSAALALALPLAAWVALLLPMAGAEARSHKHPPPAGVEPKSNDMARANEAPPRRQSDTQKTEAQLQDIKAEIERVARQISNDQVEKSRLSKDLRTAELSVSKAREGLDGLRRQRAATAARRAALAAQKQQREAQLGRERGALAGQLRAAYMIGREEPLKLLLNQRDPSRAGRMFAYYSYFGHARADQIQHIQDNVHGLEELDGQLQVADEKLAELEKEQRVQVSGMEQARSQRSVVLANFETESHNRTESLDRLRSQQAGLEKLLRELRKAIEKFPIDGNDAFAKLRGKLAWPVTGKLVARFGETRAGGVKWDGVLLATERGAQVRAVYQGRVVYADWLPGLGLLTIVDHGDGYMSLYAHNERLFKAVGEQVAAGDAIASAGDSGGTARPELYFEIRKAGKPVDPRPWFKAGEP